MIVPTPLAGRQRRAAAWAAVRTWLRRAGARLALALLLAALCPVPAGTQTATASIRGTVRESGGVVPGVSVSLVNEETGAVRTTTSNSAGEYDFSAVPPGTYTLRASLPGFRTVEETGIRVAAHEVVTLDVELVIGGLEETVTVSAGRPGPETATASVAAVMPAAELQALPTLARNAYLLSTTLPTVVASGNQVFTRLQDLNHPSLVSIGGGARRANNYLIDGLPHTDLVNRPSVNPSLDAIDGVTVQVHTYDAETGRTGGGTYNVAFRSGGNTFHGSGSFLTRPRALVANNFFARRAGLARPDSFFHNASGAIGGPLVRNRTFFWSAAEGYRSLDSRSSALRVPTTRERLGDFSQTFTADGRLVTIYDPLTTRTDPATGQPVRDPFPGNVIPHHRINPVALNILRYYPLPTRDVSNGAANLDATADQIGHLFMGSTKIDHRVSDRVSVSGLYIGNTTSRTNENFWQRGRGEFRFADPRDGTLDRSLRLVAFNGTWIPADNTVVTLRHGYTHLRDDDSLTIAFDPAALGFSAAFLDAQQLRKFPVGSIADYEGFGAVDPTRRVWGSASANVALSRLLGRHTVKVGFDFRRLHVNTQSFVGGSGDLRFDRFYTSANPLANGTATSGNALASFLLGYPSGDPGNQSRLTISSPLGAFLNYYGAYIQDDVRATRRLTLTYGLRVEREDGLRERENRFTVGFDPARHPGGALGDLVIEGRPVRGGLVFAGEPGAQRHQGDPPSAKFSPRLGAVYTLSPATTLRAGYGVYWAPWNYQPVSGVNYGQMGFVAQTFIEQGQFVPTTTLDNPFPRGVRRPSGSALGALTGVGGQIEFIDQHKRAPWVQQYSADLSHELPSGLTLGVEYMGATGRQLGLGGSNDGLVNINQLHPRHLALGPALLEPVANPFFGLPEGQGFAVTSPTIQRRQLLRPFPQFGDILMRQHTAGRSQYHALVLKAEKRPAGGWGGRISYTRSRLMDNQFGETNFMQPNTPEALNAYDLDAEYSLGLLDVPHRLILAPIVELPFGKGRRWLTGGPAAALLGGWTLSAIIGIESGFPIAVASATNNTGLFTRMQRANPTGLHPATGGAREERILGQWLAPAAYTVPAVFTLGSGPRVDGRARGPHRNNLDLAAARSFGLGSSLNGEVRIEVINLTNTVKVIGPIHTVGSEGFGQVRAQSGFMRLAQVTLRLRF